MATTKRGRGEEEEEKIPKSPHWKCHKNRKLWNKLGDRSPAHHHHHQGVDRISQLPDDILHPILSRLSLREACITSALSKRWRNLFPSLPRLDFHKLSFCYSPVWPFNPCWIGMDLWLESVHDILESRRAPVRICSIRFPYHCEDFSNIIRFLCNDGIQELTLSNLSRQHYTVPSCLYFCRTLTRIELLSCILKVPSKYSLLRHLTTLKIEECKVEDGDMQRLISGCRAVERLTLRDCHRLRNLPVDAGRLAVLDVTTRKPLAVVIVNAPRLESVTVRFLYDFGDDGWTEDEVDYIGEGEGDGGWTEDEVDDVGEGEGTRLVRLIESLGNIQNLSLEFQNTYMKGLAEPVTLRSLFTRMKKLTLIMQPDDTLMLSFVSCMLNRCPTLEELVIGDNDGLYVHFFSFPEDVALAYWDQQIPSDCMRNTLGAVTLVLKDRSYWMYWIKLAKFLVNNACVLKNLVIDGYRRDKSRLDDFRRELLQVQQASPDAVVELKADIRGRFDPV